MDLIFGSVLKVVIMAPLLFMAVVCVAETNPSPLVVNDTWTSAGAEHVYGFPDTKSGQKGTLTLTTDALSFVDKTSDTHIPRSTILAVSDGSDRVEMGGKTGMILRMVIPDGGGLAAGAVMHHRVGMLTVEYVDVRGGMHSAVFNMSPAQAEAGIADFTRVPVPVRAPAMPERCAGESAGEVNPGSVLVETPDWEHAQVPAAYRALVYEHVITRLQGVKGVSHVYRDGETPVDGACPAYTVRIAVQNFKPGNQVERAALGPAGMFVGVTELSFAFNLKDASGHYDQSKQIKTKVRIQTESTGVADKFAKALAKDYVALLKDEGSTSQHLDTTKQKSL